MPLVSFFFFLPAYNLASRWNQTLDVSQTELWSCHDANTNKVDADNVKRDTDQDLYAYRWTYTRKILLNRCDNDSPMMIDDVIFATVVRVISNHSGYDNLHKIS